MIIGLGESAIQRHEMYGIRAYKYFVPYYLGSTEYMPVKVCKCLLRVILDEAQPLFIVLFGASLFPVID